MLKIILGAIIMTFLYYVSSKTESKAIVYYVGIFAGVLVSFINELMD